MQGVIRKGAGIPPRKVQVKLLKYKYTRKDHGNDVVYVNIHVVSYLGTFPK